MTDRQHFHRERLRLKAKFLHRYKPEERKPRPPCSHAFTMFNPMLELYVCERCDLRVGRAAMMAMGRQNWAR